MVFLRHYGHVPEHRRAEKKEAGDNADDIRHVRDKEAHGGRYPGHSQEKDAGGEHVIEDLQPVDIRHHAVYENNNNGDHQHDKMEDQAGKYFYYGKDGQAEVHFLYQK